jgi:hypothetical protein
VLERQRFLGELFAAPVINIGGIISAASAGPFLVLAGDRILNRLRSLAVPIGRGAVVLLG